MCCGKVPRRVSVTVLRAFEIPDTDIELIPSLTHTTASKAMANKVIRGLEKHGKMAVVSRLMCISESGLSS